MLLLWACSPQHLPKEAYVKWVADKDHGLIVSKEIDNYVFSTFYQPPAYLVLQDNKHKNLSLEAFNQEVTERSEHWHINFRISDKEGKTSALKTKMESEDAYFDRLGYYAFGVQEDLYLVQGTDTLNCLLHHFERNFNLAPFINMSLVFEKGKETEEVRFVYDDQALGIGTVQMTLKPSSWMNIPQIQLP